MSITGVSAMDDINKTEDLGISQDSNLNEYPEIFNATNSELNVKENSNLNENIESNSNILSMSNDDILTENNIIPTNFTFAAIQTAVDNANNGDTITLKEGTYLNNGNGQISISKNISFVGVKGKSILDAQKTSRIFYITAQSINITDIIFMNGLATDYGGAIYFKSPISNSNINGTYINNTAKQYSGGANYFNNAVSSSNITGTYINNTANGNGGANNFHGEVSNSNIGGTYNNNTANKNGGANYFNNEISNSNINGTYINNNAKLDGGANHFNSAVSKSNITGTYNNNTANKEGGANHFNTVSSSNIAGTYNNNTANKEGGANNFYSAVYSSNITGTYNNNTANINGGANYFYEEVSNSNITGTYNNNTANSIIYFDNNPGVELNSSISNSIFLNNNANHAIYVRTGNVTASNNWFGNNASNYNEKPKTYNVEMPNWLFLNATANPNTLSINETSDILFKLYSTDGSNVSDFDNTQIPVINLTLTSTHGNINPNNTALDENVEYTATTHGTGSITAKVENAEHTIYLKNIGKNAELSVTTQNITYTENETIILSYNNTATGKVNITLKSKNYNKTIQKDINDTILITDLPADEYNVTVEYNGDEIFYNATANTSFIVKKLTTEITTNTTMDLFVDAESKINYTIKPADAVGNIVFSSNNTNIIMVDSTGNLKAKSKGSATITVHFSGSENYTPSNATITVTVNLNNASVTAENMTLNVGENDTIKYTTNPEGLNVTFMSDNSGIVSVNQQGIVTALKNGTATITVSVGDSEKYAINKTVITVTVTLNDANVTAKDIELKAGENGTIEYTTTPEGLNVSFTPDDTSVISVNDNGTITAIKAGTAQITITVGDNKKYTINTTTITVTVTLNDANVTAKNIELTVGENGTIEYTTNPTDLNVSFVPDEYTTNPTDLNVSFVPDDSGIVKVSDNGTVTALKAGTAQVTITVGDGKKYAINSTVVIVTVNKIPTEILIQNKTLDMVIDDVADPVVSLMPSNAGNLSFKVSDTNIILVNGHGSVMAIGEGTATVTVSFDGNDKYLPSNATITVTVSKVAFEPEIDMANSTLTVAVPENATGNVTLTIGNETFAAPIKDGVASFDLSDVPSGNYNATVTYPCDDKYAGFDVVYPVSIEGDFIITAEDLTKYYHGPERFAVNLTDNKGNPIANANISISINSKNYTRTTNDKGQAFMTINLNAGEYPVVVTYNGTSVDATVTVLPTVNGTDIIKVFRNGTQYYATFRDSEGNYLKDGETVRFNIHGVMYDRKVSGDKGLARLNINLEASEYIITAMNSITGDKTANNITVLSRLIENADLVKYFRNASQYTVKVIGDDGKAVGTGENVTFNINGVFYTHQTNTNSIAKLNINLQPSDYIITAEYKGCLVSNNIKVLPTLNATDITMKYRDGTQFKATLVDGQGKPYVGQNVTFNINGVFYNRPTDSTGTAKLNINLMPGEYIITSSHNGSSIANKITITG
ncbi:Ig-like domain-containing protein [uncultured Methanobrevibacter sp.]|uniref:beta strand repeat-containing protein n=1 Tax=uncultured Methanobrevibacter sp. TaxID=253161 RepID=UPI0025E7CB2A|nr:Ig-like domain-containing protein [uncultured Methanobrevibacter sp.]